MIYVTRPYLPPKEDYFRYVEKILSSHQLTNAGPLVRELEQRLEEYLGVRRLVLTCNGTLALLMAYRVLGVTNRVITTPFSFVATTSSLVWHGLTPCFCDISATSFNMAPDLLGRMDHAEVTALVPVHVFGNPCDVDAIERVARGTGARVIYDAAHAFGVEYRGEGILSRGDASVLSFHATKPFHTVEGGAVILRDEAAYQQAKEAINFGYRNGQILSLGINAKMNEFQAAMGLCVLDAMDTILEQQRSIDEFYSRELGGVVQLQEISEGTRRNYSYFPIVLPSADVRASVEQALSNAGVCARRYFYPSLASLPYVECESAVEVCRSLVERILCLPTYAGLTFSEQKLVVDSVKSALRAA